MIVAQQKKADLLKKAIKTYEDSAQKELQKIPESLRSAVVSGSFNIVTISEEIYGEKRAKEISEAIKQYQSLTDTIIGLKNEYAEIDNTIRSLNLDKITLSFDDKIKESTDKLENLEYQIKLLDDNDLVGKIKFLKEQIKITTDVVSEYESELVRLITTTSEADKQTDWYNDRIDELVQKYREAKISLKEYRDGINDVIASLDLENTALNLLEKNAKLREEALKDEQEALEEGKKALEETIREQKKIWEEYYDNQKKKYQEDYEAYKQSVEDKYNTEIENFKRRQELLDRTYDDQKYQKEQEERRKKLAQLEERYNMLSVDNSGLMEKEKLKLFNEITELREEIAEKEQEYMFKLQKNQTEDIIDLKKKERDRLIRIAEENKNKQLESIETQKKAIISALDNIRDVTGRTVTDYKNRLNEIKIELKNLELEQRGFSDRVTELMSKPIKTIVDFFNEYIEKVQLSKKETEELINKITQLENMPFDVLPSSGSTSGSSGSNTSNNIDKNAIIAKMKENSAKWFAASPEEKQRLSDENLRLGSSLGWYRDPNGVWYDEKGIRAYHSGGFVGNKPLDPAHEEVAKVLKGELMISPKELDFLSDSLVPLIKNVQNLTMPTLNISKLPNVATAGVSQPIYLNINMGGVSIANDLDINKVTEAIGNKMINKLRNYGIGTNLVKVR